MRVQSFADLMNGHKSAEILNLLNNEVVRRLIVVGDNVEIDGLSPREEQTLKLAYQRLDEITK